MAFEPFITFLKGIQNKLSPGKLFDSEPIVQNKEHMAYMRQLQREISKKDVLHTPLDELDIVVFDMETTGFYPYQGDEIISIGAIKILHGQIQETNPFYSLVHTEKEISGEIENLTGIRNQQLIDAPKLPEVLDQFLHFSKDLPLIAHHAVHEKSFLQHSFWKLYRKPFQLRIIDTSFLYRLVEPELQLIALEDLCEHNGIPVVNRHHALGDAILAAKLWITYVEKLKKKGIRSLQDVYEHNSIGRK